MRGVLIVAATVAEAAAASAAVKSLHALLVFSNGCGWWCPAASHLLVQFGRPSPKTVAARTSPCCRGCQQGSLKYGPIHISHALCACVLPNAHSEHASKDWDKSIETSREKCMYV